MLPRVLKLTDGLFFSGYPAFRYVAVHVFEWFINFFDSGHVVPESEPRFKKIRKSKNKLTDEDQDPEGICCAHCHACLTHANNAIAIEDRHQYIVTNPSGITFNISIYNQVNCKIETDATGNYSWFTGYQWRVISCPDCLHHIGWSYQKGHSPDFYGLIVDKLIDFDK